ncbi:hypothetical protein BC827DRAFT_613222 [Russula dissimulans]|nr:hypothetical protein BC827DRAFT_613222 [Russula dissimulans]
MTRIQIRRYEKRLLSSTLFHHWQTVTTKRGMRRLNWVFFLPVLTASGPVFAQISYPNCTASGWKWSYNSLNQNPCNVAASLAAPCSGGQYNISPLSPGYSGYTGPPSGHDNFCQCNTVVYSLISACGGCQGGNWTQWSQWSYNCTAVSLPSTYPYAIPGGTRVPHWAYLNLTTSDIWSVTAATKAGDSPEVTPLPASQVSPTTSARGQSPSLNQNSSHAGQIAGAVVGSVVGGSLLIGIIFWYLRRRRWRVKAPHTNAQPTSSANNAVYTQAQPAPFSGSAARIAGTFGLPDPDHSLSIGRYYNPSDPSTFPRLVSPPSMSGTKIAPNRRNEHNLESTNTIDGPHYSGLPLV